LLVRAAASGCGLLPPRAYSLLKACTSAALTHLHSCLQGREMRSEGRHLRKTRA
jgi:hypothetical protein